MPRLSLFLASAPLLLIAGLYFDPWGTLKASGVVLLLVPPFLWRMWPDLREMWRRRNPPNA